MLLPVSERRFYLGLLTKDAQEREERMEEMRNQSSSEGGKGRKVTRVSGNALKSKMKSGDIPLT